jgi:tetratricopeptide (TPR) repeat protein
VLAAAPAPGQTLAEARALLDSGRALDAAASFEQVMSRGRAGERAEAASLVLLSLHTAGRHDLLEAKAAACRRAAEGTAFAAHCDLYRGRSLRVNAKDTTAARALLSSVAASPASDAFAASGALYEIALIDLDTLRLPFAAHRSLEDLLARYPASPFADDALVALARAGRGMERLDVIDDAARRLAEMKARPSMRQTVQLERALFMQNVKDSPHEAAQNYRRVLDDYPGHSQTAAAHLARVRLADLVPGGDFERALHLYDEVAASTAPVESWVRDWAKVNRAVYLYQLRREDEARAAFERLAAERPKSARLRREIERHLTGLSDPESSAAVMIEYDRAIRFHRAKYGSERALWDLDAIIVRGEKGLIERLAGDSALSREERAQMLYRLAFAYVETGRQREGFDLSVRILEELQPTGPTRWECLWMQAMLLWRFGRYDESASTWQRLIESDAPSHIKRQAYLEFAMSQSFAGDKLGAALSLEELRVRFPASRQAESAGRRLEEMKFSDPGVVLTAAKQRPYLTAKWQRPPGASPGTAPPDVVRGTPDESEPVAADPVALMPVAGGAQ